MEQNKQKHKFCLIYSESSCRQSTVHTIGNSVQVRNCTKQIQNLYKEMIVLFATVLVHSIVIDIIV